VSISTVRGSVIKYRQHRRIQYLLTGKMLEVTKELNKYKYKKEHEIEDMDILLEDEVPLKMIQEALNMTVENTKEIM
jgi:hypothetical protein